MKRFLLLWLLIVCNFVGAQKITPNPKKLSNGENHFDKLEYQSNTLELPYIDCAYIDQTYTDFYYYEINSKSDFSFKLTSLSIFNFAVWKFNKSNGLEYIFDFERFGNSQTSYPDDIKSVRYYLGDELEKGLRASNYDNEGCIDRHTAGTTGYLKHFSDVDVNIGEYIIIGVYGDNNDQINLTINTLEIIELEEDTECIIDGEYDLNKMKTKISLLENNINVNQITFYDEDENSTLNSNITSPQIVYAHITNINGELVKKYKINFTFQPSHVYPFRDLDGGSFLDITNCVGNYKYDENEILRKLLSVDDISGYSIYSIDENTNWRNQSTSNASIEVIIDYSKTTCKEFSSPKKLNIIPGIPEIPPLPKETVCTDFYNIDFAEISTKIGYSSPKYELKVTLNNKDVQDGESFPITVSSPLNFKIKVKDKENGCESLEEDYIVERTPDLQIKDYNINKCLNELIQTDVDDAIRAIKNETLATLTFEENGQTILENDLLEYIKNNISGTITVTGILDGFCKKTVELTYNLDKSSFEIQTSIEPLYSPCLAVNQDFVLTQTILENHLNPQLGSGLLYDFIDPIVSVQANSSAIFRFKVSMKNGENCWSDEMQVEVFAVNQPDFDFNTIAPQTGNCDDEFPITNQWLIAQFGSTIQNYDVYINTQLFIADDIMLPLSFDVNDQAIIDIEIRNRLDSNCSVSGPITVNRAAQFVDDIGPTQAYLDQNKITFCDGDQPTNLLDYILSQHPTVIFDKTENQIVNEMTQNSGQVTIKISRVGECGEKSLQISYTKVDLPTIDLPDFPKVCAGEIFDFDISSFDQSFTYYIINEIGTRLDPIDSIFDLAAGSYTLFAENSSGCKSNPYMFTIETFPSPIIKSVSIENGTLVVVAEGSGGKLEYSLDNENWQTSNTFQNIEKGINYTVWVRENGCGGVSVNNIYVLNLPNFISPNGDGYNDTWQPIGIFENDKTIRFHVFDRYGNTVLLKEGIENVLFWDGKRNGYPLPSGDYWYTINYPKSDQNSIEINIKYSGNITIKNK